MVAVLTLNLYGHLRVEGVRLRHALPPGEPVARRRHVLADRARQVAQPPRLALPLEPHQVAVEPPGRDAPEPREEGLERGVDRVDEVERRARAARGEPEVRRGAHLAQGADVALLPVGRHHRPGERAPRHGAPGVADAELAAAGLLEEHAAARVCGDDHRDLVAADAAGHAVAPAPAGGPGHGRPSARVVARERVRHERLVDLDRAARPGLEGGQGALHHLEQAVAHREARAKGDPARRGAVPERRAGHHHRRVLRPHRTVEPACGEHAAGRASEGPAATPAQPPLRAVRVAPAPHRVRAAAPRAARRAAVLAAAGRVLLHNREQRLEGGPPVVAPQLPKHALPAHHGHLFPHSSGCRWRHHRGSPGHRYKLGVNTAPCVNILS